MARDSLTRILKNRGYQVTKAGNGSEAIIEAKTGSVSIVIMDIRLGQDLDGIDTAAEIQSLHPLTSFIFISAYMEADHRRRALERRIRVGGWVEKPIQGERLTQLLNLVDRERHRLEVLASLQVIQENGGNPFEYLRLHEGSLPPGLLEELYSESELRPLEKDEQVPDMLVIADEIDHLYDQISDLIMERLSEPNLPELVRPLRERLRSLMEQEALAIGLHVRSQLLFDAREGRNFLDRAERLLKADD